MYGSQRASSSRSSHSYSYSTPAETYDYTHNSNPPWFSKGSPGQGSSNDGYRYLPSEAGVSPISNHADDIPLNATSFFTSNSHGPVSFHPHHFPPSWASTSTSTALSAGIQQSPHKNDLTQDSSSLHHSSLLLPTSPHPMAIQITPRRSDDISSTHPPPPEIEIPQMESDLATRSPTSEDDVLSLSCSKQREKKHGCWMCHKSFDRPSTLRKVGSRFYLLK